MEVQKEVDRLMSAFEGADAAKLKLLEGAILENARLRCQLEELNEAVTKTGMIKFNTAHPEIHKMTPIFSALIKLRASYVNSTKLLCKELSANQEEFDDDLGDFE